MARHDLEMNAHRYATDALDAEAAISELQGEAHQLRKRLRATEIELASARGKIEELSGHLARINQSSWWRVGMFLSRLPAKVLKFFTGVERSQGQECSNAEKIIALPLDFSTGVSSFATRLGVFVHAFNLELLPEILKLLSNVDDFSLYVSTDTEQKKQFIELYLGELGFENFVVRKIENRGRDIAAKFYGFADAYSDHDFVLHLHTKKSSHTGILSDWGTFLLRNTIGSRDIVSSIALIFDRCPELGVIAPPTFPFARTGVVWGPNFAQCQTLAARMGVRITPRTQIDFPAGSMFWARTKALQPLLDLNFDVSNFDDERGQIDGTLAHAIERLVFFSAERAGYSWVHAGQPEKMLEASKIYYVSNATRLPDTLETVRRSLSA